MDEQELEVIDKARDILGEFCHNFAFCFVTEDGELFYDFRDRFVGKALFAAAIEDMESNSGGEEWLDWPDDDEDEDGWDMVGV